jgi:succinoglycan biosynthesis transport protein ExoP
MRIHGAVPMRERPEKIDAKFIKGFIRRRKKIFIAVSSLIIIGTIAVAFLTPKVYVSSATILIEGQIAGEILKGVSMGFIEERLQVITQQILTRDKLLQISKQLNLLDNPEDPRALDTALDKMRKNIEMKTIQSGDLNPRSYRPSETVAFRLSYSADDPLIAHKVAAALSSLYVQQNLQRREQITKQTTAVLQEKLNQLQQQTSAKEKRLNEFRRAHAGEFPENMSFNLEQIHRLNTQLDEVNARIKQLEEMKAGSSGQQLTSRIPAGAASSGDQASNDPMIRLAQLRAQLVSLQSKYSDKHPDVRKTKAEIQRLENQLGVSGDGDNKAISPSVDNELNRQLKKRDDLQIRINEYNRKSQMSSVVQTEYSKLSQESESASKQYNDTLAKLTDAKVAKEIENDQLGEKFIIIEEPQVPTKPEKPNRLKIMFGGLFLALFGGVFATVFMENMDHSITSTEQLRKITKLPVLTILPYVMTDEEKKASTEGRVISKVFEHMKRGISNLVTKDK